MKFVTLTSLLESKGYDIPYCPTDDWSCPYHNHDNGRCMMDVMDGTPPYEECDAFYDYEENEEEEDE